MKTKWRMMTGWIMQIILALTMAGRWKRRPGTRLLCPIIRTQHYWHLHHHHCSYCYCCWHY